MDFLTPERLKIFLEGMITLVLSIAVHEAGHAFVADRLGDRLPRSQGRVTLNPVAHADPFGTLLIPGLSLLFAGGVMFGWGRPVMTNPLAYTRRLSMRVGHLLVAAAGPMMNVLFAMLISLISLALYKFGVVDSDSEIYGALSRAIFLNFLLAIFNLIPAPPLDGGTVLAGLLPTRWANEFDKVAKYGPFVLLAFLFIPQLGRVLTVPAAFLYNTWAIGILGLPYPGSG